MKIELIKRKGLLPGHRNVMVDGIRWAVMRKNGSSKRHHFTFNQEGSGKQVRHPVEPNRAALKYPKILAGMAVFVESQSDYERKREGIPTKILTVEERQIAAVRHAIKLGLLRDPEIVRAEVEGENAAHRAKLAEAGQKERQKFEEKAIEVLGRLKGWTVAPGIAEKDAATIADALMECRSW